MFVAILTQVRHRLNTAATSVTLDTLDPSAGTGSGYVQLCGRSTVGMYEGPVEWHRRLL